MKIVLSLVILSVVLLEARGFPYNPYYGSMDSLSYGSSDTTRGGLVMSRYYSPYYNSRAAGGGMAAFVYKQPQEHAPQSVPSSQYYLPDRRRQTLADTNYVPTQQNEVYYPQQPDQQPEPLPEQQPENPILIPTEATEIADPTEKSEVFVTTPVPVVKATAEPAAPELAEPDVEEAEPAPKAKKVANKKKQVKRPIDDDDEEEDDSYPPRMPTGAFFPMFFGWGGRSRGGPSGPTAIANAYSTGKGGVATSHATAYGGQRPEEKL